MLKLQTEEVKKYTWRVVLDEDSSKVRTTIIISYAHNLRNARMAAITAMVSYKATDAEWNKVMTAISDTQPEEAVVKPIIKMEIHLKGIAITKGS